MGVVSGLAAQASVPISCGYQKLLYLSFIYGSCLVRNDFLLQSYYFTFKVCIFGYFYDGSERRGSVGRGRKLWEAGMEFRRQAWTFPFVFFWSGMWDARGMRKDGWRYGVLLRKKGTVGHSYSLTIGMEEAA